MIDGLTIRPTGPDDRDEVLEVVRAAFSSGGRDGHEEVDIVVETWQRGAAPDGMDLVAVAPGGEIVGHVLAARGGVGGRAVLGIAPLAVAPAHHGGGVGSALMRRIIEDADRRGEPMLVLLGNPAYYGRFGFEPASTCRVFYAPVGEDSPHFQVRRLSAFDAGIRGEYVYCWEQPLTLP